MMFRIVFTCVFFALSSFGADTEGFRNLMWGNSPSKEMVLISNDKTTNISKYMVQNDKLNIGAAQIESIRYWFYDNKFMAVFISFNGLSNFNSIRSTLESKHGMPSKPNRYIDRYMWNGGNSTVAIQYSDISSEGMVMIVNQYLSNESESYKKTLASKAVNDL